MLNGMLTIPSSHKKYAWVSAEEAGPYHVETHASAANGGNVFRALCGAAGLFNCYLNAQQVMTGQKCATCQQLSTSGILDIGVAPQGVAGVSGECGESAEQEQNQAGVVSDEGQDSKLLRSEADNLPTPPLSNEHLLAGSKFDVADQGGRIARDNAPITEGSLGGGHPASVPSPEVHDGLTIERIQVAVLNAEMRARHVPNFSVSSEVDPAEDSRFA